MRATSQRFIFTIICFFLFGGFQLIAAPVNDEPCGAIPLSATETCTFSTYDNNAATASAGIAAPGCGNYSGADVWFQVQMPNNGYHLKIDLQAGTLSDLAIAVYEGADCNSLSLLSCDANSGSGNMPSLIIDDGCLFSEAGKTFWIRVWDENGDESGTFDICVSAITPPVSGAVAGCGSNPITGNTCCDAILLTDNMNGYCGNTGGYTDDPPSIPGFCAFIENNSWIAFVAEASTVEIGILHSNCASGNGIQAILFETSDCTNFTQISEDCWNPGPSGSSSGSLIANNLTPGETYYLMIDGWNGEVCDYTLSIVSGVLTTSATATDSIICAGQSTTLSANVYGVGPYTYSWTPAASLDNPSSPNPTATPMVTTTYTLVVTSPNETVSESVQIVVDQAIPGPTTIDGATSVCENSTGVLYSVNSVNATQYTWTVNGGGTIVGPSDGSTLAVDWGLTGGAVCVTPANDCGAANEVCINVSVSAAPQITATDPPHGCSPGFVNLAGITINNSTGGIGVISFFNTFSDANNGVNQLPSPLVYTGGTYWVRMDTGVNCFDVTSVTVTIEEPDIVAVDPQPVCSPSTIDLDTDVFKNELNGWGGGTYSYFTDSLDAVNNNNPMVGTTVNTSGTYWLRYETAAGCVDVAGVDVNIEVAPDISADAPLYICSSASVDISTAAITDANNANVTTVNYFLTDAFAGLGWPALAMTSTVVSDAGTYYVRYETAAGCWDTAHIEVITTMAPSATISGGEALCAGEQGVISFTMTGTAPFDVVYNDGTNDISLTGISSPYNESVTINANTDFTIVSVTDAGSCPGTFSGLASFTVNAAPEFSISGSGSICNGEDAALTFELTGTAPFDVVYNDGTSDINLSAINNGHNITVSPNANTTYTPVSVVDANGCTGIVNSGTTISLYPAIQVNNLQETCNGTNTMYTVTFQLTGGDPSSYQVTGGGSFDFGSNTFTSNPISSGASYQFLVSDANCGPMEVNGAHACNCTTQAGTMGNSQMFVCESATVNMNYDNGEILDADDVIYFVLHDSPGPGLGNILMTNSSPTFNYDPMLTFEQTYYVSAVVGSDDGTGIPDLNDPCLDISNPQELAFYEETEVAISAPPYICEGETTQLTFSFTGTSTYNVEYTDGTNTYTLTGISEGYTVDVTPVVLTTYTLVQVSNTGLPFCTGFVPPANNSVTITPTQQPTVSNLIEACDNQNQNYTVSFEITGGVAAQYFVNGNAGNLVGNLFTSNPIPEGTPYSFTIGDGVCPSFEINGEHSCDCITAVGNMQTTPLLLCEGDMAVASYDNTEVLDADDVLGFVLHDSAGAPFGNVLATNSTPSFAYMPSMTYGTTYYISAVVANGDGTGFPVLDQAMDPCLAVSQSQPVTFFTGTELSIDGDAAICSGETTSIVFNFSTPGTFDVEYTDGTSNFTLTDIGDGYAMEVQPNQTTTYSLLSVQNHEAPYCIGTLAGGNTMVTVDVTEGPLVSNMVFECDAESIFYTITFEITGGSTANYSVTGLDGTLTGNTFVSTPLLGGSTYSFEVNDGGPCPAQETGVYECLCMPDMRPILSLQQGIGCGGDADGIVNVEPFSGTAPYTFIWSNGTTGEQANGLAVGWHYITMTDTYGCEAIDSIYLDEPTPITASLSGTDPSCFDSNDGSIRIESVSGGSGNYDYSLDVLASFQNNTFTDLVAGQYTVTIKDDRGCEWEEQIWINAPGQFMVDAGDDLTIRLGDSISLEVFANAPLDTFYWSPQLEGHCVECMSQYVYPTQQTIFKLTAISENACQASDQFVVTVKKENPIYIPSAFSPNGDGVNDLLNIFTSISVRRIKTFNIYTRWGALIYKTVDFLPNLENRGWDGFFKGRLMNAGVYVYFVEVEYVDGTTEIISGDVTLMK